ncbi:hypothetical protein [Paenibacillus sp. DCT19]|uniref:hypothetical protein n=1 Tax=Paenibacillus sp. DCT19 TaxID=2211212 RepID=UPI000FE1F042|nr:hypothetical protein [Paenibacillus sp. DCT19]
MVYEFNKECEGKQFYLYNSERFLQFAKKLLKLEDTFLDTAKVTGAIEGIKELKKNDYQFELSNTRKAELIKEVKLDFPHEKFAKGIDYVLNNDSEELRVNFVLSIAGEASREKLSNFGDTIKNALLVLYDVKAWVYLKHNAVIGDNYYYSFEIIGATKVKDQLEVLLNSVASSLFSSNNTVVFITN